MAAEIVKLGPDHPDAFISTNNLALADHQIGDDTRAELQFCQILRSAVKPAVRSLRTRPEVGELVLAKGNSLMKKIFLTLMLAVGAPGLGLNGQEATKSPPAATQSSITANAPAARGEDATAIRALLDAFTKAFDRGDAAAAAATYTETAIVVDEEGNRIEGRAAIRDQYAASFAGNPGTKIAIRVDSLRFLGPETALEEGRTTITPAPGSGAPEITRFTAVYVKDGGQWRQAAVRDELAHELAPHDRLKELEWLVGEWVNESQDAVVSTTCTWAKGGNFLDREFTVKIEGRRYSRAPSGSAGIPSSTSSRPGSSTPRVATGRATSRTPATSG